MATFRPPLNTGCSASFMTVLPPAGLPTAPGRSPASRHGRRRCGAPRPHRSWTRTFEPSTSVFTSDAEVLADEIAVDQSGIGVDQVLRHRAAHIIAANAQPLMLLTGQMHRLVEVRKASSAA